jgi:hypothetical protein
VRRVHQAALCSDAVDHVRHRQHVGNPLGQEQPDDFSRRSADLFADNDANAEISTEGLRRVDRVMIRNTHDVEVNGFDAVRQLFECGSCVARGGGVQMAVKPYPAGLGRRWRPNGTEQQKGD